MTHKRSAEAMGKLQDEVYRGMAGKGIVGESADEIWEKLQGFASFGFPESHSVSFAYIVYMSAWLKYHWPAEFLAGLLNAYPMGFYSPNSLVQDAGRHGVITSAARCEPVLTTTARSNRFDADPHEVVTYYQKSWRRGRGAVDDPDSTGGSDADGSAVRPQPGRCRDHQDRSRPPDRWTIQIS